MLSLVIFPPLTAGVESSVDIVEVVRDTNLFSNIDWFDVIFQLFITGLGFAFALWSARWLDGVKEKKDKQELKRLLKEELSNILDVLTRLNVELLDVQPLKIPLWESVINTGQISLLDFETRKILFGVYGKIKEYNSWCLIYTNYYFEKNKKNDLLLNELKKIKSELIGSDDIIFNADDKVSITKAMEKL